MNDVDRSLLEDMLAYAADAIMLLGDRDAAEVAADMRTHYAVIRAVEVGGEAASKVSVDLRADLAAVQWRKAIGMRHVLIHDYNRVNVGLLVETARDHSPQLVRQLQTALGDNPE
ncbi:HepT-like ribonuclease domain-containing protein [Phenylobacterium sp.]|uniref:HepT-like ribonuclease domain-containing protein n=1 Tax=Phenylobacterium sp. TaxID=1871053 RepID=UPI0025E9CD12|nr:HepT-like ribonuclease domain-containing protein [Phenylobacterium sp.]